MDHQVQVCRLGGHFEAWPLDQLAAALDRRRFPYVPAFSADRIDLIGRYAATLQADPRWRGVPAVLALAFWLRKAAIVRMADGFQRRNPPHSRSVGRGIAFHLPPQNVDTLFLYSWAVAFACGAVNVVRLPEQISPTVVRLLEPLIALLEEAGSGDLFVSYSRQDEAANARLSAIADCRLVWGGDAKAESFNKWPLRIGGKSLMFTDRYSHAVLSASAVAALDEADLDRLAKALHDDIRLFDQQACSSPHTIHLLHFDDAGLDATRRLLERVDALARQAAATDPAHGMAKFASGCAMAAADAALEVHRLSNETTILLLAPGEQRGLAVGGGFLSLRPVKEIGEVTASFTARDQTLTHFGLQPEELESLAGLAATRGVARLVPVGSALDFDTVWDGYDLLGELTRVVRVVPDRSAL